MSLVGPRPLLEEYLPLYSPEQARRHEVPPGITGWAQVNGRNALTWEDTFALDVWYVDHWSPALDLRILLMTILRVLRGTGVSQPGQATREKFTGSRPRVGQAPPPPPVVG
jgi:lipopolysaccharide/colanic/teichoic acid biosynthesis glycosyltransferase